MTRGSDSGGRLEDRFPRQTSIAWPRWVCATRVSTPLLFAHRLARLSSQDVTITPPGLELYLRSVMHTPATADRFPRAQVCSQRFCDRMVTALRLSARITTSPTGKQASP